MAKRFHVQYKIKKNTRNAKKGDWVNAKRRWRGRMTDQFSWGKAALVAKSIEKSDKFDADDVRLRMVRLSKSEKIKRRKDRERVFITQWLHGDLDGDHDLMLRMARVARDLGHTLYVAEAKRSIAEQWRLWRAYKAGYGVLAAFPGTSRHTWGKALDVRRNRNRWSGNLGAIPGARAAMKKHGLCLPVRGEDWHCEKGTTWRA